jgi:hypothetical protein
MRYLLFFILFFCAQSYGQTLKVKLKQLEQPSLAGQIIQSNSSGVAVWRSLSNATGNIVTTDANGQFNYRTPTQILSDIGAAPSVHTHDASAITSGVLSVARIPNLDYIPLSGSDQITGNLIRSVTSTTTWAVSALVGLNAVTPAVNFRFGVYGRPADDFCYAFMTFNIPPASPHSGAPFKLHMNGYVGLGLTGTDAPTQRLDVNGQVRIRTLNSAAGDVVTTSATGVLQKQTPSQIVVAGGGITTESDPTVPAHVKAITTSEIDHWNDAEVTTNKAQDFTTVDQTLYPSTQAVVDYINDEKGVAQWNADKLQGTDLLIGSPINGQVLIYDGGWKNLAPPWITGNQTIVLSGDVTGSGATSISTTIANNAITTAKIANSNVTLSKIQDIGTKRILGRSTSGSGVIEELQLSDGLFLSSGYLYSLWYNEPSVTGTKIRPSASSFPDGNIEVVSTVGFGRAYNYNFNSDCYEITEKDERYINTTNTLVNLKFNIDNLNEGQTIKISNRSQEGIIRFTNILCEPGDVIVDYFDDKGDPIYLNRIGSGEKYDWVEIQRVTISSQDYLLVVEAGKTF